MDKLFYDEILNKYIRTDRKNVSHTAINNKEISGLDFEKQIAAELNKNGFLATLTKNSADYGVDLILEIASKRIAIQCKHYSGVVGNSAVQEVYSGMKYYSLDMAIVLTDSYFSKNARYLAEKCNVILIDKDHIQRFLKNPLQYLELENKNCIDEKNKMLADKILKDYFKK